MTELKQVYKCNVCGNIVEMLHSGAGSLVCCGQEMVLQQENIEDAAVEKHVPVIERVENGVKITVGSVNHPMEDAHFIEWVELLFEDKVLRCHLMPGQDPVVTFKVEYRDDMIARAYCNLHGLWTKSGVKQEDESIREEIALSN